MNPFEYDRPAPAPAGGIVKGAPINSPNHWSRHRRPATDAEIAEVAAATFEAVADLEDLRLLAEAHPDVFAALPHGRRLEAEAYAARRQQAIAGGKQVAEPGPDALRRIDVLAQLWRATSETPPELVDVDGAHRARLVPIARAHGLGADFMAAIAAWEADRQAAREFLARQTAARRAFGIAIEGDGIARLGLRPLREFVRAIGDPSLDR